MATLNIPLNGKVVKGRTPKALPSVDLTAMVDLAFLLITFFMLTTSLSKMSAMDVAKPVPIDVLAPYPASRTMTIVLGKNDQVLYYMGEAKNSEMKRVNLSSIRREIVANRVMVENTHRTIREKQMLIIIKPTTTSLYNNFVDIIDEMKISGIQSYAIDDKYILKEEVSYMKANGL